MYLLFRAGGYPAQAVLWQMQAMTRLKLQDLNPGAIGRTAELMEKYRDQPMDLADASLVAMAEQLGMRRVFTLDSHFQVYRLSDGSAFEVAP